MNNRWLTIKQLDEILREWQEVHRKYGSPKGGWIKTLRKALGFSAQQLASMLNLSRSRVAQMEQTEARDAITLRALKEVAEALDCELVYAIVPKNRSTLESIIKIKSAQLAEERVLEVAHTMSLEKQSVDEDILKMQKKALTNKFVEQIDKKIWTAKSSQTRKRKSDKLKRLKARLK